MTSILDPRGRAASAGDDRKYDETCAAHARAILRTFVEMRGGQTEAARILGVNQGTLSRALRPENQPSLRILIALSRATGRTLDALLGLDLRLTPSPPPAVAK